MPLPNDVWISVTLFFWKFTVAMSQRWLLMMEGKPMPLHRLNEERDVLHLASSPEVAKPANEAPVARNSDTHTATKTRDWLLVASKSGGVQG
ncbi:hypothetical protein [Pseudovibrio sp. W64]|uniref:hypothetical protein n=2 Tax=unclassified Pseudovibrio TaxID=2627060 RepID=UPI0012907FE9|nr:hypothetical protein [Pseudovibrio sp. W64]